MYSERVRSLSLERCFNHAAREAVACCPECRRYFCRECVTEHDTRLLCATCLKKSADPPLTRRRGLAEVLRAAQLLGGVLLAWLFFYWVGQTLLGLPNSFHDGTLWRGKWLDNP
jgi:hypothetical protein